MRATPKKVKDGTSVPRGEPSVPAPVPSHPETVSDRGTGTPYNVVKASRGENPWGDVLQRLLAVDPGDVHVGIAEFVETIDSWECVQAYEMGWESGLDRVAQFLEGGHLDFLVVENFRLYAEQAKAQIGSEMLTSQFIGAVKYLHSLYARRAANRGEQVAPLELQPASIQKATAAITKGMGIESEAKGNDHARSAELHGWCFILRQLKNPAELAWAMDNG